jgi:hypothetical protein
MLTMIYMTHIQNMSFFVLKVNNPSVRHPLWPRMAPYGPYRAPRLAHLARRAPCLPPLGPLSAPRLPPSSPHLILQRFCNGFAVVLQ